MFVLMPPPYGQHAPKESRSQDRILSNYLKIIVSLVALVGVLVTMITKDIYNAIADIKTDQKTQIEKEVIWRADVAIIKSDLTLLKENSSKRVEKEDKMFARYGLKMEEDQFDPPSHFRLIK
jgi:hypothetical protein